MALEILKESALETRNEEGEILISRKEGLLLNIGSGFLAVGAFNFLYATAVEFGGKVNSETITHQMLGLTIAVLGSLSLYFSVKDKPRQMKLDLERVSKGEFTEPFSVKK